MRIKLGAELTEAPNADTATKLSNKTLTLDHPLCRWIIAVFSRQRKQKFLHSKQLLCGEAEAAQKPGEGGQGWKTWSKQHPAPLEHHPAPQPELGATGGASLANERIEHDCLF